MKTNIQNKKEMLAKQECMYLIAKKQAIKINKRIAEFRNLTKAGMNFERNIPFFYSRNDENKLIKNSTLCSLTVFIVNNMAGN